MRPPELRPGRARPRPGPALLLLLALLALYLAAAQALGARRWDGFSPEPYRYVSPPPGYQNPGPPAAAQATITFSNGQAKQTQIFTTDLQAQLLLPAGAFPPNAAGSPVTVTLTPRSPPPLTGGLYPTGNAYAVLATYPDGTTVPEPWKQPVMLALRFPSGPVPNGLYLVANGQQTRISQTVDTPTLSVQGNIDRGGVYLGVGTAPAHGNASPLQSPAVIGGIVAGAIGFALVIVGVVLLIRRRR